MTKELKADISLLLITVVWGGSFPVTAIVLKYIAPYSLICLRYLISGLILAIIFHKRFKNIDIKTIKAAIIIGISLFIGTVLQVIGMVYTTPSKSGFITGLYVVFVPIILAFTYKKIPDIKTIIGIVLSVVGLGVISINGSLYVNFGDFLTFACSIAFAAQIIFVDTYVRDVDVIVLTCIQTIIVGVLAFIPAMVFEKFNVALNLSSVYSVMFLGLFCTMGAYFVQNKMQPYTNPTHAAIIFLAEPVFSAIFSTFIGDNLTGRTLIGCILILSGMVVINIKVKCKEETVEINNNL